MQEPTNEQETTNKNKSVFGPVIFSYTRAQAIEDGVLVDVSEVSKEIGIRYPVAVTRAVWDGHIVPPENTRASGQSEDGRLWDTLFLFAQKAKRAEGDLIDFSVLFFNKEDRREVVEFKAHCGPGDNQEPVITIMLPNED